MEPQPSSEDHDAQLPVAAAIDVGSSVLETMAITSSDDSHEKREMAKRRLPENEREYQRLEKGFRENRLEKKLLDCLVETTPACSPTVSDSGLTTSSIPALHSGPQWMSGYAPPWTFGDEPPEKLECAQADNRHASDTSRDCHGANGGSVRSMGHDVHLSPHPVTQSLGIGSSQRSSLPISFPPGHVRATARASTRAQPQKRICSWSS